MPYKRPDIDTDDVIRRYVAGESELSIARSYGANRESIQRRLRKAGVTRRSGSEANLLRMGRMTADERRANAAAANAAARNRVVSDAERARRAQTVYDSGTTRWVSPYEVQLTGMLQQRGVECKPQFPVGKYNIDIACGSVAVEVHRHSGQPHRRPILRERIEYLINNGWSVMYVWISPYPASTFGTVTDDCADKVAAFVKESNRDPSARGQYRVVRGSGDDVPVGGP